MSNRVLLTIPVLATGTIGALVLWVGAPREVPVARVWGGPTDGLSRWSGWVEAEVRGDPVTALASARVNVWARAEDGRVVEAPVQLDADGQAELALDFGSRPPGSFVLRLHHGEHILAEGAVHVPLSAWRARASRRGGYFSVASRGQLVVRAAAARGAFAVPFAGPLWVRVEDEAARPVSGASIQLKSEGASLSVQRVETGADGIARATLVPREHVVTLSARVLAPAGVQEADGVRGELTASLPIVPGALVAERRGSTAFVSSPVERAEAFVTIVSELGRHFGAKVPLSSDGAGISRGAVPLPPDLPARAWAVVESTRGAPGEQRVGWPLFAAESEPALTFDARDVLVADGARAGLRREHDRQRAVRRVALGIGVLGAVFSAALVFIRVRQQSRRLAAHLNAQSAPEAMNRPGDGALVAAIVLIALGFLVTAAISAWRLG